MATVTMPTPNVVVIPAPERPGLYSNYASTSSFALGGIQIGVGLLLAVIPVATLGSYGYVFLGVLVLSAGICGVAAGNVKKSCQIIGFMVVSIIASVITVPNFIVVLSFVGEGYHNHAVSYILIVLLLIESIVSIWSAAICCRSVCCGRRLNTEIPVQYQVQTGQVMMTMVNPGQVPQQQQQQQQQQQPAVPNMVLPPYPGQQATAPAANSAYCNQVYNEDPPPKY